MAILQKRTSTNQLPQARGLERSPLSSIINDAENARPNAGFFESTRPEASRVTPIGGVKPLSKINQRENISNPALVREPLSPLTPKAPITSKVAATKPALTAKPAVTKPSATKPAVTKPAVTKTPLTTKPSITSKTTTPATKTTTPTTSTVKPAITTNTTAPTATTKTTPTTTTAKPTVNKTTSTGNSLTSKVTNALTGAAIGAGTKLLYDKLTGKPTTTVKTGNTGNTGGTGTTGGTGKSGISTTPPKLPVAPPKPTVNKPTAPVGKVTPKTAPTTKPVTSVTKPATGGTSATDIYKGTPADPSLGLPEGTVDNGDGTYTVDGTTFDMSTGMPLYRDNESGGIDNVTDNGDGTYTIGNTTYSMDDNSVLYTTDADGNITVAGDTNTGGGDGEVTGVKTGDETGDETQYFTDEDGNVWSMDSGGAYTLFQYADGTSPDDTTAEENTWTDPDTGAVYTLGDDGLWTTDYVDTTVADNTDDTVDETDNTDYTVADNTDYTDDTPPEEAKRGGLITMMRHGGAMHFAGGGQSYAPVSTASKYQSNGQLTSADPSSLQAFLDNLPQEDTGLSDGGETTGDTTLPDDTSYMPDGAVDNGDGTFTLGNQVYDMNSGNPLYTVDDSGNIISVEPSTQNGYVDNGDGTYTLNGTTFDMQTDMPLYRDNPNGGVDMVTDNGDGTYTVGNSTYSMDNNKRLYDTDANGNVTNVSDEAKYTTGNQLLNNNNSNSSNNSNTNTGNTNSNGNLDKGFLDKITGALGTTAGAAGAGALLASLLGGDFGGGGGSQNQGVDMSKVGVINPRTTDFGIGPTRYVGYDDYGVAPDQGYTPNEELLKNLNAPGYNPVNEGDYGYADNTATDQGKTSDNFDENGNNLPNMAAGGLSSMSPQVSQTHYTFGKPADVYATLGLRNAPPAEPVDQPQPVAPPQMQQPQGQQSPQGQPPAGMPMGLQKPPLQQMGTPQAMPPPMPAGIPQGVPPAGAMRKGGLPHVSNVPQVNGRFDFRQGSAVHGEGDGQSDDIPAMLADGEYVIDAETVAQIGNGSTKAGAQALDKFRESIRAHKRSAPLNKIPPKTKALTSYLKGAK